MKDIVLFAGGLAFLVLFVWHLAAVDARVRMKVGTWLWVVCLITCLYAVFPASETIKLGLDLRGGTSFMLELQPGEGKTVDQFGLDQAVEVIRKRVDAQGVSEPLIQPVGERRIRVDVPDLTPAQVEVVKDQLQRVAKLEFRMVHPEDEAITRAVRKGQGRVPVGYEIMDIVEEEFGQGVTNKIVVGKKVEMAGKDVSRAWPYLQPDGRYAISLQLSAEGKTKFGNLTQANVRERLAIVLDDKVRSAPVIQEAIWGGSAQISGDFSPQEAAQLASVLENPLENPVKIIEQRQVAPSLGSDSVKNGVIASAVGSVLVIVFMLVYYRVLGVVAMATLVVNAAILVGLLAQLNFTLTLPGIAGMVLTVGMAVDSNVLIYERIREEQALGKPVQQCISAGFDRALSSIVDANLTTILTAIILFWLGSGPIQGFAVTLCLGILGTLFAAIIVTRNVIDWFETKVGLQRFEMMQFIGKTQLDFMGYRHVACVVSAALVLGGIAYFASLGDRAYGVDFTGGEALTLEYAQRPEVGRLREAVAQAFPKATVVEQDASGVSKASVLVRAPFGEGDRVEALLKDQFPAVGFERASLDTVGPVVGRELLSRSAAALVLSLLGILVYVAWRFEFSFALGAIVALVHDVLFTIGMMAVLGQEMSLVVVGALLTIAGFSVNDTIVIFDRVRETLRGPSQGGMDDLLNEALNLTLSRTILTSGTVFLTVTALCVLGGPVLFPFSLAMLIGIIAGTYSTVFIASPIVYWWTRGRTDALRKQLQQADAPVVA